MMSKVNERRTNGIEKEIVYTKKEKKEIKEENKQI